MLYISVHSVLLLHGVYTFVNAVYAVFYMNVPGVVLGVYTLFYTSVHSNDMHYT